MELSKLKDLADIVQALFTTLAIGVGGFWSYMLFVRRRQKYPRATLRHEVEQRFLGEGMVLLHVATTISNTGEVLLSLASAETRVQQIIPPPSDVINSAKNGKDPVKAGETEVGWPLLCHRKMSYEKGQFQIEPGESDSIHYDFFLNDEVRSLELNTYVKNQKIRKRDVGWNVTTLFDMHRPKKQE